MRSKFVLVCAVLAVVSFGCSQTDDEPTASITALDEDEFIVTGSVVDAKEGVEPEGGFPDDLAEAEDFGGLAVRPVNPDDADGLEDCDTVKDAYVMYYTDQTLFDPPSTDASAGFPESVEGETVSAQGTIHDAESGSDDCLLVAERVEIEEQTEDSDGGDEPAVGGTDSSPGASGSPGAEETIFPGDEAKFPKHEDTDPIFEGTPSPDPCEGAKACREKREEEEETPAP